MQSLLRNNSYIRHKTVLQIIEKKENNTIQNMVTSLGHGLPPFFWVGASFYKQTNLHIRFVLGSCKTSRSPHQPTKILEVYIESLSGFSFVYHPDGLNTQYHITVSKLCPLKMAPAMGTASGTYIGVRVRIQGPAHRSTDASPLYDLLQHSTPRDQLL